MPDLSQHDIALGRVALAQGAISRPQLDAAVSFVRSGRASDLSRALLTTGGLTPAQLSSLQQQLKNGSRVISLPGTGETVRGFSAPDLIVEDEAAFVEDSFYRAVRPMLAVSGGRLILMSTPYGKRGHFYEAWNDAAEWHRVEVPATDCPRITSEFLKRERKALGDLWFEQEYLCRFADVIDAVFRMADIERAVTDDVTPLFEKPPSDDDVTPLIIVEEQLA